MTQHSANLSKAGSRQSKRAPSKTPPRESKEKSYSLRPQLIAIMFADNLSYKLYQPNYHKDPVIYLRLTQAHNLPSRFAVWRNLLYHFDKYNQRNYDTSCNCIYNPLIRKQDNALQNMNKFYAHPIEKFAISNQSWIINIYIST